MKTASVMRSTFFVLAVLLFARNATNAQIAPTNTATITGSLSDSNGNALPDAVISLDGPKHATATTDNHGQFVFVGVPLGTYTLSASTKLGTIARTFSITGDENVAVQYEPSSLNGLKTIASVHANATFNVTSASVTQVNPRANALNGTTSWRKILEQIPGLSQAGLGNGKAATAALPDGPTVPVQISVNGTLPYETAVLLDDMPLIGGSNLLTTGQAGAGTDLSYYALNAFDAADVIRGPGASAPSIVDSIGGSFVLHAPSEVSQSHTTLSLSTDPYGGIVTNALMSMRWHKLSVNLSYGINNSPGPMNQGNIPAFTQFNPSTINGSTFLCSSPCAKGTAINVPGYYSGSFPLAGYNVALLVCCPQVSTAWNQHSGSLALTYEFSPAISAEVFYAGQAFSTAGSYQYYTDNFVPPNGYTGSIPAGQQLLSANGLYLNPALRSEASGLLEEKVTASLGNGLLRLKALQNRTFTTATIATPTSANLQLFGGGSLCLTPPCSTANPLPAGFSAYTPAIFNGGMYNVTYASTLNCYSIQDSNNRDMLVEYTTPLGQNFHAGASVVQSYYDIPYQQKMNLSISSIPSAVSQTTNEFRLFAGGSFAAKTSADLSFYLAKADYHVIDPNDPTKSHYIDASYSYAAPRLGMVWRPTAAISIRGAAGGGFAEAPLNYIAGTNSIFNCGAFYYGTIANTGIQPEKSFAFDLGTDIQLRANTILSLDLYRANLYGQFYRFTGVSTTNYNGTGHPLYISEFGNLGLSRFEGILLDVKHDVRHGLYWTFSGGLTRGYLISAPSVSSGFYNNPAFGGSINLNVVPNVNFNGSFTSVSVPYSQALGKLGYRWNADKYIDVAATYYGNNNTYFRPAFVEFDGHIEYPVTKQVSVLVTFRNITGIYDGATQVFSASNVVGVPTISGPPYALFAEEYGPRTVIVSTLFHI